MEQMPGFDRLIPDEAPRPFVAFAAIDRRQARRLYRASNLIWVWLGIAAVLSGVTYLFRPDLGPVQVTHSAAIDAIRMVLFASGGALIASGVWWIRRSLEVCGHVFFATGVLVSVVAQTTLPGPQGVAIVTLLGLAAASGFRAFYIVKWMGAEDDAPLR